MVKAKKKLPAAAVKDQASGSNTGDDDHPTQKKKRGRPRKIVQGVVKEEDRTGSKKQKKSGDAGAGGQSKLSDKSQAGDAQGFPEEEEFIPPKPVLKRQGSRRKSEPRRAAESSVIGR